MYLKDLVMRELKFRVFDSISKKLHTWDVISMLPLPQFNLEHYTLEQFTGLKDKNGVDIYESDYVLDSHGQRILVIYDFTLLSRLKEIEKELVLDGNLYQK
jgi:uncharacterized phage protein (TIGR01671 family)